MKCKPWTERLAKKRLSRQVSRAAWKRRRNHELEAKKAHKPWIREGLNREVQTVNYALSASKIPMFQLTICTSWFPRPWKVTFKVVVFVFPCVNALVDLSHRPCIMPQGTENRKRTHSVFFFGSTLGSEGLVHCFADVLCNYRAELKGTNSMGQTGFCENLRFSANICENLRFSANICENLRFSAQICTSQIA